MSTHVLYELLTGEWPSLTNLSASKEANDELMHCLERLPKNRLARSPSHPIQLSRSAESIF